MNVFIISDIHLGNPKLNSLEHINEIRKFIKQHMERIKESDIFIIAGDTFDKLLSLGVETNIIFNFFKDLDTLLFKHDVDMVILEGTLSHDYRQAATLASIFRNATYTYVDNISVHTIKGMDILFVPDSLPLTTSEYTEATISALADKDIDKVPLAIMHGMFKHHIDIPTVEVLDQDFYSTISDIVVIGHNHRYQQWNNIYTPGSLSRDRQGEEDLKGGLFISDGKVTRLINDHTREYVTYDLSDFKHNNEFIRKVSKLHKVGTELLIKCDQLSTDLKAEIANKLSLYTVRFKSTKTTEPIKIKTASSSIHITPINIEELIKDGLPFNKYTDEELSNIL